MWPNVGMFILFLMLIPAVILLFMPVNVTVGYFAAPLSYLIIMGVISLSAPVITVADGSLHAGHASIPCDQLGEIEVLDSHRLTLTLGHGADSRAFLCIRGWIHSGLKIENIDPADPAPYWVVTTRKPGQLKAAIESARVTV